MKDALEPRKVVIYVGSQRYGSDITDANGAWKIEDEAEAGRQYRFTVYPENCHETVRPFSSFTSSEKWL